MRRSSFAGLILLMAFASIAQTGVAQQPPETVDVSPIDGEIYYLINQRSGMQADSSVPAAGNLVSQQPRSFTKAAQRWAFARAGNNRWDIRNVTTGLCLLATHVRGDENVELGRCPFAGEWELLPAANGYYSIRNSATNRFLDVDGGTTSAGGLLVTSAADGQQSELWLLRPTFFRGVDNALLEKQEALRVRQNTPWWTDDGHPQDLLRMFKDHGVNMIRMRPSSAPPYVDPSAPNCVNIGYNDCYAETEAQDLDLAKRAKNLGLSIELSLLFDGGSSRSIPPVWTSDTLQQAEADLYAYVKAEIESYRSAGVMPDLVAIGNEVDTGFLGSLGSPTGAQFGNFAALQKIGMQAIQDAASDPALGPPIPAPLTCIHITPAWDLTSFFTLVNQNGIPYDMICQSYYPIYHGPLTDAQAAAANPYHKPVEQDVLITAAQQLGKPIFIIETGEHYENGFNANDPWYPPSIPNQRQFLLDLQTVVRGLPQQLGAGIEYWDPEGVNILAYGGPYYFNGGYPPDSIYIWNGLTLFNNGDTSGSSNQNDPSYSEALPGLDALGNKLDPMLKYKLVTPYRFDLRLVPIAFGSTHWLWFEFDSAATMPQEQWLLQSDGDGFFQLRSAAPGTPQLVLDGSDPGNTIAAQLDGSASQEWDVQSLGNGLFQIVNRISGRPVSLLGSKLQFQITPTL
ncbi:MAG: glycosyl hydrolase 53 family protein [Terriglobales bacterium]